MNDIAALLTYTVYICKCEYAYVCVCVKMYGCAKAAMSRSQLQMADYPSSPH